MTGGMGRGASRDTVHLGTSGTGAGAGTGAAEFVHLHVASGFSMRYGTSTPEALV